MPQDFTLPHPIVKASCEYDLTPLHRSRLCESTLRAIWRDELAGTSEIFYKKSMNGGASWGNLNRLTWNLRDVDNVRIAVDSNDTVHVVWRENGINYRYSTDGGMTWSPRESLSLPGASSSLYMIIDSNNTLHLTWQDNSSGNFEIYYQKRE